MAKRISLREFQEGLVRRLADATSSDHRTLLGIQAGEENWIVDLPQAGEILPAPPLSPVPLTRPWYRGLANVRGTLYGVVDFAAFQGGPPITPGGQARLLLIGAKHGVNCAILVSRIVGLRSPEDFEAAGETDARLWVSDHRRDLQSRPWLKLDVPALLAAPQFLEAGVGN